MNKSECLSGKEKLNYAKSNQLYKDHSTEKSSTIAITPNQSFPIYFSYLATINASKEFFWDQDSNGCSKWDFLRQCRENYQNHKFPSLLHAAATQTLLRECASNRWECVFLWSTCHRTTARLSTRNASFPYKWSSYPSKKILFVIIGSELKK